MSSFMQTADTREPALRAFSAFERPRLMRRLAQAARYPIVFIVAPAGYGKTTALRQFLTLRPNAILIALSVAANSLEHFVRSFARGCSQRFPEMAHPPEDPLLHSCTEAERVEIYTSWAITHLGGSRCTIALDDLQNTDVDAAIGTFLTRLVDATKAQIQWIFASRTSSNLPHARWQAYADSDAAITAVDLRMSIDEALGLAQTLGSPATERELGEWVEQVHGFPVPLTYAIRSSVTRGTIMNVMENARSISFAFLAEELWAVLSDPDHQLLELAALLPPTHLSEYEYAGIERATERLRSLTDRIAFLMVNSDGVLSIHDLFVDFIKQRIALRDKPSRDARYISAAELLRINNRNDEAFQCLIESGNLVELLRAVESYSASVSDHSVKQRLIDAIQHIPLAQLGLNTLAFQNEYWSWIGDSSRARCCAEEILRREDATSQHVLSALHSFFRLASRQSKADHELLFSTLPTILDRLNDVDRAQAEAYQAALLAQYPESTDAARNLVREVQRKLHLLQIRARIDAQTALATALYYFDDDEEALLATADALSGTRLLNDPREQARALSNHGLMLFHVFDSAVESIFEPLREVVEKSGSWRFSALSHWLPAQYYALKGDVAGATTALALQIPVTATDEASRARLTFFRRHSMNLCSLLGQRYAEIVTDFRRSGLPKEVDSSYELLTDVGAAFLFLGQVGETERILREAATFRHTLSELDFDSVREAIVVEIISLCGIGRWSEARRLFGRVRGSAPKLSALDDALSGFSEGPPFTAASDLIRFCIGKPYSGLPALLMTRLIDGANDLRTEQPLTLAEMEVLQLLGLGKSNKEIAAARSRSIETIKRQVAAIYQKLGVENRTSAVAVARSRGFL